MVAHRRHVVGVGDVRLANRSTLKPAAAGRDQVTDLDLVIDRYLARGPAGVSDLVGDFAFVLWDLERGTAFAARDAIGVKPLFYQRRGDRLTIASSISCLEPGDYDYACGAHPNEGDAQKPARSRAARAAARIALAADRNA